MSGQIHHGYITLDSGDQIAILNTGNVFGFQLIGEPVSIIVSITHADFDRLVDKLNQVRASLEAARKIAEDAAQISPTTE
jgi:hypothetical protein